MKDKTVENPTIHEYTDLDRMIKLCENLQKRLEAHDFEVVKLAVRLAPDVLARFPNINVVIGIEAKVIWDNDLPPGTIRVAALVQ